MEGEFGGAVDRTDGGIEPDVGGAHGSAGRHRGDGRRGLVVGVDDAGRSKRQTLWQFPHSVKA